MKRSKDKGKIFFKSHPLEGDGFLLNLYHYLWKKNKNLDSCPLVRIPHTVVYEHNFPRGWYSYDEKNRELKKKTGKLLDTRHIIREFSKKISDPNEIVASYLSKKKGKRGKEVVCVEFFNYDEFDMFMWKRGKKEEGVLQKFVVPKGDRIERKNSVIQAIWSPHIFTVERRTNFLKLHDTRYSLYEKAVTYEGPAHYSTEFFCAPQLAQQIEDICKSIVRHFKSTEHKNISRMVLYFKIDNMNKVWLLWGSSLRISDGRHQNMKPLTLSHDFVSPNSPKLRVLSPERGKKKSPKSGALGSSNVSTEKSSFKCPNCQKNAEKKHEVTVERIVEYYQRRAEQRRTIQEESDRKRKEMEEREIEVTGVTDNIFENPRPKEEKEEDEGLSEEDKREVIELLDDLMYKVYSHFLVMKYDEPFQFFLPEKMPDDMKVKLVKQLFKLGVEKLDPSKIPVDENGNIILDDEVEGAEEEKTEKKEVVPKKKEEEEEEVVPKKKEEEEEEVAETETETEQQQEEGGEEEKKKEEEGEGEEKPKEEEEEELPKVEEEEKKVAFVDDDSDDENLTTTNGGSEAEFFIRNSSISIARFQREVESVRLLLERGESGRRPEILTPFPQSPSFRKIPTWGKLPIYDIKSGDIGEGGVPKVIQRVFPDMTPTQFKHMTQEGYFLARKVALCEECWLMYISDGDQRGRPGSRKGGARKRAGSRTPRTNPSNRRKRKKN